MRHKVTLISGEGIGPEVAVATRRVLGATGVQIDWEEVEARAERVNYCTRRPSSPCGVIALR
jgi:isocitrate dehydrogenase (NAD+)